MVNWTSKVGGVEDGWLNDHVYVGVGGGGGETTKYVYPSGVTGRRRTRTYLLSGGMRRVVLVYACGREVGTYVGWWGRGDCTQWDDV